MHRMQRENLYLPDLDDNYLAPQLYTNCAENMEMLPPRPAEEPTRVSRPSLPNPPESEPPVPRTSDAMEDISRPPQLPKSLDYLGDWRSGSNRPSNENRLSVERISMGSSTAGEQLRLSLSQPEAMDTRPPDKNNPFEGSPLRGISLYSDDIGPKQDGRREPIKEESKDPPSGIPAKSHAAGDPSKLKGCNCKKSRCLKLYCECLALQKYCTPDCNCVDCHNTMEHKEERETAVNRIMTKNPNSLLRRVPDPVHEPLVGCNCKRSSCQQNYCYCYKKGINCGKLCKCTDCANHKGQSTFSSVASRTDESPVVSLHGDGPTRSNVLTANLCLGKS